MCRLQSGSDAGSRGTDEQLARYAQRDAHGSATFTVGGTRSPLHGTKGVSIIVPPIAAPTRLLAALLGVGTRVRCATGSWPLSGRCAHRSCSRTGFLSVLEYRPIQQVSGAVGAGLGW